MWKFVPNKNVSQDMIERAAQAAAEAVRSTLRGFAPPVGSPDSSPKPDSNTVPGGGKIHTLGPIPQGVMSSPFTTPGDLDGGAGSTGGGGGEWGWCAFCESGNGALGHWEGPWRDNQADAHRDAEAYQQSAPNAQCYVDRKRKPK